MTHNIFAGRSTPDLIRKLGIPMIVSMVLQALYNVVDTAFVINMGEEGVAANLALTYAFPVQILMIAVGVGTGVGINALLSRSLGEGDREKASRVAGNGIFLGVLLCLLFVLFGIFLAEPFVRMQANGDEAVIRLGVEYLQIVSIVSLGSIGFAVVERFVQASGKTMYSTVGQISGALTNIVLDYFFIYPLHMGVAGAAWATVIGQILSLLVTLACHIFLNPAIDKHPRYIRPSWQMIREIYHIGLSAMLMQGLLSVMMLGVNLILSLSEDYALLTGAFGIYYKIQQMALFACFGLSNTLITLVSYYYGCRDSERLVALRRHGLRYSVLVAGIIFVLFEVFAQPIAYLFGLSAGSADGEIVRVCANAIRLASLGYICMGITVGVQGILQGLRQALTPLLLSSLRLVVLVFPLVWAFSRMPQARWLVWLAFPIAECLCSCVALFCLRRTEKSIFPSLVKESSHR